MPRKEKFYSKDEMQMALTKLKSDPAYLAVIRQIEIFRDQALGDILTKDEAPKEKGEYSAYQRVLKIPDLLINNLQTNTGQEPNFDPYSNVHQNQTLP